MPILARSRRALGAAFLLALSLAAGGCAPMPGRQVFLHATSDDTAKGSASCALDAEQRSAVLQIIDLYASASNDLLIQASLTRLRRIPFVAPVVDDALRHGVRIVVVPGMLRFGLRAGFRGDVNTILLDEGMIPAMDGLIAHEMLHAMRYHAGGGATATLEQGALLSKEAALAHLLDEEAEAWSMTAAVTAAEARAGNSLPLRLMRGWPEMTAAVSEIDRGVSPEDIAAGSIAPVIRRQLVADGLYAQRYGRVWEGITRCAASAPPADDSGKPEPRATVSPWSRRTM